ncbi:hypothetical protein T09_9671 [Trichinella sp. T9]|nr:hypothetical protein T09_9671 [Trichinella sp. T9]
MSEMFYVQKLAVSSSVERELVIDGRLFCVLISAIPETWNPYIPYLLEKHFSPKMDFMGISRSETLSGVERTSSRRSWLHSSRNMH